MNFDSTLDILDVIIIINMILGINEPSTEEVLIADMNFDNVINVQDIILLVNQILNRN